MLLGGIDYLNTYSVFTRSERLHLVHLVSVEQTTEHALSRGLSVLVVVSAGVGTSSHLTKVFLFINYLIQVAARLIKCTKLGMQDLTTVKRHY